MSLPPPKGSSQRKKHLFVLGERDIRHRPCSLSLEELSGFDLHPELSSRVFSLEVFRQKNLVFTLSGCVCKDYGKWCGFGVNFHRSGFQGGSKKMESWLFWGLKVFHSWQPVSLTAASKKGTYGFFGLHLQDRKANCDKLSIPKKMIPKLCFSPGPVQINRLWFTQWGVLFFIVLDFFLGWKKEKRTVFFSH